jgi:hypothetical protein
LVLCRFVWVIDYLSFFLVPFWSFSTPLYPQSATSQGTCPNFLIFDCFHFIFIFESIKELESASHQTIIYLPTYLPHTHQPTHPPLTYLPTYLLANYPPTNPPTYYTLTYPPIYLPTHPPTHTWPTCLPTYLPTYLPTHSPSTYLPTHSPAYLLHQPIYLATYLLFSISYNLPTSYLSSYHLLPTS